MKRPLFWVGLLGMIALLATTAASPAKADPPPVHQFISAYNGPQTCATCHPNAAREVAESTHYQQKQLAGPTLPQKQGEYVGMLASY